jgi:FixJ family two-component response regulator
MASSPPRPSPLAPRPSPVVYVLDDEPEMVKALTRLLRARKFEVLGFASVRAFLEAFRPEDTACLVLDVAMPELDGLELQRRLTHQGILIPIVFLTGHGDIPMSVHAMKAGAAEFLTKPFRDQDLLDAIQEAIERDRAALARRAELAELQARYEALTPREREVMGLVVQASRGSGCLGSPHLEPHQALLRQWTQDEPLAWSMGNHTPLSYGSYR